MKMRIFNALAAESSDISFDVAGLVARSFGGVEFTDLSSHQFDRQYYFLDRPNHGLFKQVYQRYNLLRKHPNLPGSSEEERVANAVHGFLESEYQCNQFDRSGPSMGQCEHEIFTLARRRIGQLLSSCDFSHEAIVLNGAHGPGATFDLSRSKGDAYYKMGIKPTATPEAARYPWTGLCDLWGDNVSQEVTLVRGSRFVVVPKDAKTHRGIAIEPTLNMFLQKGVGRILRRALRTWGIDLDRLQHRNRVVAQKASASLQSSYATIDLSRASDSISLELCLQLLPVDLFKVILELRSPEIFFEGSWRDLWKVSSMGNGFTFELESLIFSAFALAACEVLGIPHGHTASYGDDIVIPSVAAGVLTDTLSAVGFDVNDDKSFTYGPFRESCGGHFFNGHDVTPIYIKKPIVKALDKIWLANSIRRKAFDGFGCDSRWKPAYDFIVGSLPQELQAPRSSLWDDEGNDLNISLGGNFDEVCPRFCKDTQVLVAEGFAEGRRSSRVGGYSLLCKLLWSMDQSNKSAPLVDREFVHEAHRVRHYPVKYKLHAPWPDVGPWV